MNPPRQTHDRPTSPWRRPLTLAGATAVVIAVFYLLREHWGHVLGWWPYLLLMLCPLMHLFHGHGGHSAGHDYSHNKNDR